MWVRVGFVRNLPKSQPISIRMEPRDRVARFFGVELPALLRLNRARLRATRGSVTFVVPTAGEWRVDLGAAPEAALSTGTTYDAELTVVATPEVFARTLAGDVPEVGQGFGLFGDARVLRRFLSLLTPAQQSAVGVRAALAAGELR